MLDPQVIDRSQCQKGSYIFKIKLFNCGRYREAQSLSPSGFLLIDAERHGLSCLFLPMVVENDEIMRPDLVVPVGKQRGKSCHRHLLTVPVNHIQDIRKTGRLQRKIQARTSRYIMQ